MFLLTFVSRILSFPPPLYPCFFLLFLFFLFLLRDARLKVRCFNFLRVRVFLKYNSTNVICRGKLIKSRKTRKSGMYNKNYQVTISNVWNMNFVSRLGRKLAIKFQPRGALLVSLFRSICSDMKYAERIDKIQESRYNYDSNKLSTFNMRERNFWKQ